MAHRSDGFSEATACSACTRPGTQMQKISSRVDLLRSATFPTHALTTPSQKINWFRRGAHATVHAPKGKLSLRILALAVYGLVSLRPPRTRQQVNRPTHWPSPLLPQNHPRAKAYKRWLDKVGKRKPIATSRSPSKPTRTELDTRRTIQSHESTHRCHSPHHPSMASIGSVALLVCLGRSPPASPGRYKALTTVSNRRMGTMANTSAR